MANPISLSILDKPSINSVVFGFQHRIDKGDSLSSLFLEIKVVGTPWTRAIVRREIKQAYSRRRYFCTNLPKGKDLQARITVTTSKDLFGIGTGRKTSNIVSFNTISPPSQPSNVTAIRNSSGGIGVNWNCLSDGGSPPLTFIIDYSINGGSTWYSEVVPASQATPTGPLPPNTPIKYFKQFNFSAENRNNSFIFRVTAQNAVGMTSAPSANTNPIYLEPTSGSSVLFDKSSFDSVPSPWRERLIFAAEEWEKFIKIDPDYADALSRQYNYKGIKLKAGVVQFVNEPSSGVVAGCRPDRFYPITTPLTENKFVVDDFILTINSGRTDLNDDAWKQTLVHELGHALGIGVMWQPAVLQNLGKSGDIFPLGAPFYAIPTRSRFLNSVIRYPNMEESYNELKGTNNIQHIPLMWQTEFDEFNRIGHFSYQANPHSEITRSWLAAPEDIMSYGHLIGSPQRITGLSIGALLDFGYVLADTVIEANQNVILTYDPITGYTYANSQPITYLGNNLLYKTWDAPAPIRDPVFTVVGADVIGGVNKVVQRHNTGLLVILNMTSNWEFVSYETNAQGQPRFIGLNTPEYFATETLFQTDFNNNGIIGA